jgi:rod shape-determining protein MreC
MVRRSSPPVTIIVLLVLCAGLVAWHYAARRQGGISAPESGAFIVLRPVQRTLIWAGDWVSDLGRVMFRRRSIISENEELRGRVAHLEGTNRRLVRYRNENEELRTLLKMPKPTGGQIIAADVVSMDATDYARRIVLNVGSRDGVRDKDVVFVAEGLVGQVVAVSGKVPLDSCTVLLLTDRMSSVLAMTGRTMARGIVRGNVPEVSRDRRLCKMEFVDYRADVREGDLVMTSGVPSEIFPKGLIIGEVLKVNRDKRYSLLTADIDPAVPFDRISAVWTRVKAGP